YMRQNAVTAVVFVILAGLLAVCANAQVFYGSMVGAVTDSTGAVVPNADVSITNPATSQTRTFKTDSGGRFTISDLQPGTYDVSVKAAGFRPIEKTGVTFSINTVTRVDAALEVGQVSEQVTVEASAVALQTDKSDVHSEISEKAIENLPLSNYRNYQSLIDLVPGATP